MTQSQPQLCLAVDAHGAQPQEIRTTLYVRLWKIVSHLNADVHLWEISVFNVRSQSLYLRTDTEDDWSRRIRLKATNWEEAFAELNALLAPTGHKLGDSVFISPDERTQHYLIAIAPSQMQFFLAGARTPFSTEWLARVERTQLGGVLLRFLHPPTGTFIHMQGVDLTLPTRLGGDTALLAEHCRDWDAAEQLVTESLAAANLQARLGAVHESEDPLILRDYRMVSTG